MKTIEDCKKGQHDFLKAFQSGRSSEQIVIRWCRVCGAIVGDLDYDGRTQPGRYFEIKLPSDHAKNR